LVLIILGKERENGQYVTADHRSSRPPRDTTRKFDEDLKVGGMLRTHVPGSFGLKRLLRLHTFDQARESGRQNVWLLDERGPRKPDLQPKLQNQSSVRRLR
jgi:hypothetical protein